MTALTDNAEARVVSWLTGVATTAPTLPLKARLMTANGSDAAGGVEVAGGGYAAQAVTFVAGANNAIVRFDNLPACTVVGVEIWDSNGVPFRWLWAPLTAPVVIAAGQPFEFAAGVLVVTAN